MDPKWLDWVMRLQTLAQNGLAYTENPFDQERFQSLRDIAAEIAGTYSDTDFEHMRDLFAAEVGYATPKVAVRGAVFRDDSLLFVRERHDNLWAIPGGWADADESPSEAVVREVFEESGCRTRAVKLLMVFDRNKHGPAPTRPFHVYHLFFRCELEEVGTSDGKETYEVGFFPRSAIPELSPFRVTPAQIDRVYEHYHHPELPTDFD